MNMKVKVDLKVLDNGDGLVDRVGQAIHDCIYTFVGRAIATERENIAKMVEQFSLQFVPHNIIAFHRLEDLAKMIREIDGLSDPISTQELK